MNVAFDTSVLLGLLDPQDLWHSQSVTLHSSLQTANHSGIYFDCVIAETVSVATRRLQEKARIAEIDMLLDRIVTNFPQDSLTWISLDIPALYSEIIALMRSSQGELNFNDALIALACRERNVPFIASFDRDFDQVSWIHRLAQPGDLP